MLQERGPRQKTRLMTDIITFGVGNSTILNQGGKTKILSYVACFYSKCLAKMKNERPSWQCFLTTMAKTISRLIPSRLWNQFKFLFNYTHFCPITRWVPKKNITVVPSHLSSRTPPRYKGQVLLSRGNVLILSLHLTRVLWTHLTRTEDTFILLQWTDSHKLTSSTWAHLCCAL